MKKSTVVCLLGCAALALAGGFVSPYLSGMALTAIAFALLGLAVNLVYGYLGYLTFGHAAMFGLGAYGAALLYAKAGLPFVLAAAIALVPPTLLGLLIGLASLRVSGAYFAIATLASAEILRLVATSWVSLTRGPLGMVIQAPAIEWLEHAGVELYQYHLAFAVVLLGAVVCLVRSLLDSPTGRSWLAIRESLDLAESVGIPTLRIRVVNVALSGMLAGLAGVLLVPKILVVSPDLFGASYSAVGLLIVILGGRGTMLGPLVGGLIFAVLPETLRAVDEYRMIIFAGLLLLAVRTQSDGIIGWLEKMRTRMRPANSAAVRAPVVTALPARKVRKAIGDEAVLEISKLSKHYAGLRAVDGSNFTVMRGEIFGIIGPNGAGKSTLLKLISGFEAPTSGSIRVLGRDAAGLAPYQIARLGVIRTFQSTELYKNLTVLENVMIGTYQANISSTISCALRGPRFEQAETARRQLAQRVLVQLGLVGMSEAKADELSYGDQKLLSIALALAARPKVLLLDEPAAGLNHSEADKLRETLRALCADGLTIVIVDHNLQLMMSVCDRILAVDHGVPLALGSPQDISRNDAVCAAYLG
jgi:branched-chain amino acid transport system permease protein